MRSDSKGRELIYVCTGSYNSAIMPPMNLQVGDLVKHTLVENQLGTVVMSAQTTSGADVCEVIVSYSRLSPERVGQIVYLNQCYWKKLEI